MKRSIILLSCFSLFYCCSQKKLKIEKIISAVDSITYKKDKEQIANCFIENVEYYRQNPDMIDYSNVFGPYSEIFNLREDRYQRISFPVEEAIEVKTDTILYSKDNLLCFAFIGIKMKDRQLEQGIEERRQRGREYDAKAIIGYRKNEKESFRIYPVEQFKVFGFEGYRPALDELESLYLKKLTDIGKMSAGVYENTPFKQNVDDKNFFEKSPYFKKTKKGLYYFQLYTNGGKINENITCKCDFDNSP